MNNIRSDKENSASDLAAYLETVREDERKRIAREVHDELGQVLTAIYMDLSVIDGGLLDNDPILSERIRRSRDLAADGIKIV